MEWISVSERLPEDSEWVLILREVVDQELDPPVCAAYYDSTGVGWEGEMTQIGELVTHWMPLPSPPSGGSQ